MRAAGPARRVPPSRRACSLRAGWQTGFRHRHAVRRERGRAQRGGAAWGGRARRRTDPRGARASARTRTCTTPLCWPVGSSEPPPPPPLPSHPPHPWTAGRAGTARPGRAGPGKAGRAHQVPLRASCRGASVRMACSGRSGLEADCGRRLRANAKLHTGWRGRRGGVARGAERAAVVARGAERAAVALVFNRVGGPRWGRTDCVKRDRLPRSVRDADPPMRQFLERGRKLNLRLHLHRLARWRLLQQLLGWIWCQLLPMHFLGFCDRI